MSLLPASAVGLMSVAVLNLNNMRDMKSDALAGKKTVAMALGFEASKWYQYVLIVTPFLLIGLFLYVEIQYLKSIVEESDPTGHQIESTNNQLKTITDYFKQFTNQGEKAA